MQKKGVSEMLKMNKLMWVVLVFSLYFSTSLFWGTKIFADPQSDKIVRDYDDPYGVDHRVIHQPYLDIEVWVDKGEGATYHPGERIKVYFKASRDCYVVIYDIDTKGYVNLLYPSDGEDDYYVEGGRTYRIPDRFDDYDLTVDGPEGTEYVQAVASFDPIALPNFPGLSEKYDYDGEIYAYRLDGEDPFEFMETINREIVSDDYASDVCIFNVEYEHPRWYYWPREVYVDRPLDVVLGGAYFGYPWDVEVWIDGVFYGITPITIPYLVVGRHWVTFWYSGCWIWRDWVWIERHHTVRVWAHCDHRYRYVKERFVEKSYRDEKAKRRRGSTSLTTRGVSETSGFVKRLGLADKSRIQKTTGELKKELRVKERREVVNYKDEKANITEKRRKTQESKDQFRIEEKRKGPKSKDGGPQIQKKGRLPEEKIRSSKAPSIQRHEIKRAENTMKRKEMPRAQAVSIKRQAKENVNVQKENRRRR
jgi:hypothetical protein